MGILSIFKRENAGGTNLMSMRGRDGVSLYILMDDRKTGIIDLLRSKGIYIKAISDNIDEISFKYMVDRGNSRLVIVDTGKGEFRMANKRKEVYNIMGLCASKGEKQRYVTVEYSDPALKKNCKVSSLRIGWTQYKGTSELVEDILSLKEKYVDYGIKDEYDRKESAALKSCDVLFSGYEEQAKKLNWQEEFTSSDEESLERFAVEV